MGKVGSNKNDLLWFVCKYCSRAYKQPTDLILHKQKLHKEHFTQQYFGLHGKGRLKKTVPKKASTVSDSESKASSSGDGANIRDADNTAKSSEMLESSSLNDLLDSDSPSVSSADASLNLAECATTVSIEALFHGQSVEWFPQNSLNNSSSNSYARLLKGVNIENIGKNIDRDNTLYTVAPLNLCSEDQILLEKIRGMSPNGEPQVWSFHPFWKLLPENRTRIESLVENQQEIVPGFSLEAIQLANIDFALNHELSKHSNHPFPLTFVSSFGNFGDYFLWKLGAATQGFGLLPNAPVDDQCSQPLCYDTYSIYKGKDDETPNMLDIRTINNFKIFVRSKAPSTHVDLFIANGIQLKCSAQRSQDLILAQLLLALELLREGGIFVIKVKETLSQMAKTDIFLMSRCFGQCSIFNPESCFTGEYYIICRWKRSVRDVSAIKNSLYTCLESVEVPRNSSVKKVLPIFDPAMNLRNLDEDFFNYIEQINLQIAGRELALYRSLLAFSHLQNSRNKSEVCALQIRDKLLLLWNMDTCRSKLTSPEVYFDESDPMKFWRRVCDNDMEANVLLQQKEKSVNQALLESQSFGTTDLWMCTVSSGSKNRFVIISCGINDVTYKWKHNKWEIIPQMHLPKGTVIMAEFCYSKKRRPVLRIIDALMLDQKFVGNLSFESRINQCAEFARRLDKPNQGFYRIMFAKVFPLQLLAPLMSDIIAAKFKVVLSNGDEMQPHPPPQPAQHLRECTVREILLFKTKHSQACKKTSLNQSYATLDKDFKFTLANTMFWEWNPDADLNAVIKELNSESLRTDSRILIHHLSKVSKGQ